MPWIVAMTKPNSEQIAAVNLTRQAFENYYPRCLEGKPNKEPTTRPLFPRYIFIFVRDVWYSIRGTRGVSYVLMGDDGPQIIPTRVINDLKASENSKGLIPLTAKERFDVGQPVKAVEGPLVGHAMIYEGMAAHDRINVLISMLGRQTRVELESRVLVTA